MSPETRKQAHIKLSKMEPLIGFPSKWRDYSELEVTSDELLLNIWRSEKFEHDYQTAKIGNKVDKALWYYPPQTVNASFVPTRNQVIFPAGYLQPPHFQLDADDAVNYGSIGATIGHEIGHGFDDQGSKYDGNGELRNWWTDEDREKFEALTVKLVEQFNNFCPFEDACLNGELSLGENIGDLAGIIIAYDAYQLSLKGEAAPVIDGFTGDQRFILGIAQGGKGKWREEFIRSMILTDPHVPDMYRVLGPLQNFDVFYSAFDVKEGDGMYLAPEDRVRIW
jgi:putative endopeptidase